MNDKRSGLFVPEGQLLHGPCFDEDVLGSAIEDVSLHSLDLSGNDGCAGFDALQHNLASFIGVVDSIIRANSGPAAVHNLKGHAGQRLVLSSFDKLADDQRGAGFIVKNQGVSDTAADNDVFGRLVLDVACGGLGLGHHIGGVGGQPGDSDCAVRPGGVAPDDPALAVLHSELRTLQGLLRHSVSLEDRQGAEGVIVKAQGLCIRRVDDHRLRGGVFLVVVRRFFLCHYICSGQQLREHNLAVPIRGIEAVGAGEPLIARHQFAVGGGNLEHGSGEGLLGHAVVLLDNQSPFGSVGDNNRLCIAVGANHHIGAGRIHHISRRGLDLGQHVGAWGQIGDADFPLGVGGKNTVLRQRGCADHTVQSDLAASGGGHTELRAGEGLASDAVPLLNDNSPLGLVLERQGNCFTFFHLHGLGLRIQDESVWGAGLRDYHALTRLQASNPDLPVLIRSVDAIAVAHYKAVRIGYLKLGILEGDGGIDRTDLADEQGPIRHVGEPNGDHALLSTVRQEDGFGGLDDGVAVCGVYLLQHIGAGLETGPDGGTVFARHLRADDGAACAGGAAQVLQLEGAAGQGLAGDGVVFFDYDPIERRIFKHNGFILAALDVEILRCGLLDGETSRRLQLRHTVPAVPEQVQFELTVGV